MSSRWPELACLLLAALLEALWLGTFAALLVTASPATAVAIAFAVVAAGALVAWTARLTLTDTRVTAVGTGRRLLLVAVGLAVAAALVLAAAPHGVGPTVAAALSAVLGVAAALTLGVLAGRARLDAERAVARTVRSFALVFVVVFVAAAGRRPLPGAGVVLALTVLAGLALVALTRALATRQSTAGARAAGRWAGAVVAVGAIVVTLAVLLAVAPLGAAPAWLGGGVLDALRGLLAGIGDAIAAGGSVVVRGIVGLVGLLHLHIHPHLVQPQAHSTHKPASQARAQTTSIVPVVIGSCVVIALVVAGLLLLLRRFTVERDSDDDASVDERESLAEPAAELRSAAGRFVRRLGRLVGGSRGRTPAEALRAEYRRLERAAAKAGFPRPPSWSVRRYLDSLRGDTGSPPGEEDTSTRLATLYERARYARAAGGLDWPEVEEFKLGRRALLPPSPH